MVTEGCAALNPRLRATRFARAFVLSELFLRGKRVTISISEADLPGAVGRTPHRSLRSLCVVLTINQRLRRCAAVSADVFSGHGWC